MDTLTPGDKLVCESDLDETVNLVDVMNLIGADVDDLSAQLRELIAELQKKGAVAPRHAFA